MLTIQKIGKTIKSVDMFSSSEMLRYSEDSQYHTITGGLISLGIIFTVIAGFFNMISETMNRTAISSSLNALINYDPSPYNLTTNAQNMFMFGIQIQSTDLSLNYDFNGPRRYFDITALQFILSFGIVQSERQLPLVQCTDEHWKMLPQIVKRKDKIMYDAWLCPPLDSEYLLQGSYFSEHFSTLLILAQKCTNESDPAHPCYPQNEIDDFFAKYGNFYFTINYVNTVINPGEVSYITYYLQSMDFAIISAGTGSELYYQFSDFSIQTDTSIWPFSSYQYDKGALISQRVSPKPFMMGEGPNYIIAYIAKSSQSLFYHRQVQKLSLVISYMGGLVGAISAVLFFLKIYTDLSLQVSIARGIFTLPKDKSNKDITQTKGPMLDNVNDATKKDKDKVQEKGFNILLFVKLLLYKSLKGFKFTESWTEQRQIEMLRSQISKHLDIKVLLQRLTNLQRCLSYLYDEDQLKCLKYLKKISLEEVKQMRTIFSNEIEDEDCIEQQQQSQHQLYSLQANNKIEKKNIHKGKLIQNLSPQHISNIRNMLASDNPDDCQEIEGNIFFQNNKFFL